MFVSLVPNESVTILIFLTDHAMRDKTLNKHAAVYNSLVYCKRSRNPEPSSSLEVTHGIFKKIIFR